MKITLQTSIETELADKIAVIADVEKRSISNMLAVLIEEAIEKRNGKTKR